MSALGWLLNLGFGASETAIAPAFELTLRTRNTTLNLDTRDISLSLKARSRDLNVSDRP